MKVPRLFSIEKGAIEYPDVGYAGYILNAMFGIGFPSGERITHQEIKAYCEGTGTHLTPSEWKLTFNLFIEYSNARFKYEQEKLEPAPFCTNEQARADNVVGGLRSLLSKNRG